MLEISTSMVRDFGDKVFKVTANIYFFPLAVFFRVGTKGVETLSKFPLQTMYWLKSSVLEFCSI